jgi:hypothetical protein
MNDLYDDDILTWSEQQAELLRRRSANALDWDNLAEEIEDGGRSQLRAVESHLVKALLHDLKVAAWPLSRDVPHWRAKARGHRDDARAAFTPSMAQRIDVSAASKDSPTQGGSQRRSCLRCPVTARPADQLRPMS